MVVTGVACQGFAAPVAVAQPLPINSEADPNVSQMVGSFQELPSSYLTGPVDAKAIEINNEASAAQRQDALKFEQYPYGRRNLANTAYLGGLRDAYLAADAAGEVTLVNTLLAQGNYQSPNSAYLEPEWASSDKAKERFGYQRPYCRLGSTIQRVGTSSYGPCPGTSLGYPSGHSRIGWIEGIGLAVMLPEVAPQIMARTAEIVNGRVVLGVHSPLDVMAGRAIATRMIAYRLSDPVWKMKFDAARSQLRRALEAHCGKTIARCLADSPPTMSAADAVKTERDALTYGLPPVGQTGLPLKAPHYSSQLLAYAFPNATEAERLTILETTAIDSGAPLDTTGSAIDPASIGWTRLDLGQALTHQANASGSPATEAGQRSTRPCLLPV